MNQSPYRLWMFAAATACVFLLASFAYAAPTPQTAFLHSMEQQPGVLYTLKLSHGKSAVVYKSGMARIYTADFSKVETRMITGLGIRAQGTGALGAPSKAELRFELSKPVHHHPYAQGRVLVVYRNGVRGSGDVVNVPVNKLMAMRQIKSLTGSIAPSQAPHYTTNRKLNAILADLGVNRSTRLFHDIPSGRLRTMVERASTATGNHLLNIGNAYELHLTDASVEAAVAALRRSAAVAYASPAFYVSTMHTQPIPLRGKAKTGASVQITPAMDAAAGARLPSNYGLQSSLQSAFNAPGLNAAAAYDEIERKFNQLPGTGEIITNVSIGGLYDASAASNRNDPCWFYARFQGPTTIVQGGQRYLNFPSMPLIPTYTADANGTLNGGGEVCGTDPGLVEVGLDFSVMAPLPHDLQRPGETGSGITDLLGIAPGADYRLVVPASASPTTADIDAALLAAALQSPRPDVITASLAFPADARGFPSRYLGDDPLTAAVVGAIVNNYHIVVTIASGDGLRISTNAAVGPSGGSAPTNIANGNPTSLNEILFSTVPSRDPDSGAIDVGGTTLDDIFAAPPQDPVNFALKAQHAFAETRWTGSTNFSSGYGSRVNVSAPSDNIIALSHKSGGAANEVKVGLNGGTSASAPEVAAAAAVLMQVARLTGQPFQGPKAVRKFLEQTGTPVPKVPQSDVHNHVGPQVNLGHAVETLLARAGNPVSPQVTHVAVEQRRGLGNGDASFQTDTNPAAIDLSGENMRNWITLAPDWEGVSDNADYTLTVEALTGARAKHSTTHAVPAMSAKGGVLAHTAWARVLPSEIFAAAGAPAVSNTQRTFLFTYTATPNGTSSQPVTARFALTFGPNQQLSTKVLAPTVASVTTGSTMPVHYDLRNTGLSSATLVVTQPGRVNPWTGPFYHISYSVPIGGGTGTVNVPTSALKMGGGIYGIGIQTGDRSFSDFAYTRYQPEASSIRPPAPLLSANGSGPGHQLAIAYGSGFTVSWDVSDVPGATGAILEISAPGPNEFNSFRTFNNPNGSGVDYGNALDTGSLYHLRLSGVSGTKTFGGAELNQMLAATMYENVRVIPVAGGMVVGEASEVSTITMIGVVAADGGSIVDGGYAINSHGSDGFITAFQTIGSVYGPWLGSLETFDQKTGAITKVVSSKTNYEFLGKGLGIFANDFGIFGGKDQATRSTSYHILNLVANGIIGSEWTPPGSMYINEGAINQTNNTTVFFGWVPGSGQQRDRYRVLTYDLESNVFSPLYDFSGPLSQYQFGGYYRGIAQDTNTGVGLLVGNGLFNCSKPAVTVWFDVDDGTIKKVHQGVMPGAAGGVAIDSQTGKAMVSSYCAPPAVGIFDEATGAGRLVELPATSGPLLYVAADPIHHLFLVEQTAGPHSVGPHRNSVNNNSKSAVLVFDEQGHLLQTIERFNLFNVALTINENGLQVNPSTGTGYLYGVGGQQLAIFKYGTAPIALDGLLATLENQPASGVLKANGAASNTLTFSIVEQPRHGELTLDNVSTGDYTYTPTTDYFGDDSFTFKASNGKAESNVATTYITVKAVNHPPVAKDGNLSAKENAAASGTLHASDPDGDPLTFSIVVQPEHGTVKVDNAATGTYTYTPATDYSGSDSFTFKANDGLADSNVATINVTVKTVNKPPVASDGNLTTDENSSANGTLEASDPDGDSLTFSIVNQPKHGSVTVTDASTGAYTYTPNTGYSGSDTFTFNASDGEADSNVATVSVTVKAVAPPPPPEKDSGGGAFGWLALAALLGLGCVVVVLRREAWRSRH